MDISFKTVVEYVKNLFPGMAPVQVSENPQLDAAAIARLANERFYIRARNGKHYWYCFVPVEDIPVARYLLKANGINVKKHNSRYTRAFYSPKIPVLRVLVSDLKKNPAAKDFVDCVMKKTLPEVATDAVTQRVNELRKKVR